MKLLYLQDFHLLGKASEHRKDNYQMAMFLKLDEILDIAEKNKVDFVVDGGDFLESSLIANTIVDEVLDRIEAKNIIWYMLFGNHCEEGHEIKNSKGTSLAHMIRRSKCIKWLDIIETADCYIKGIEYKHNIEEDIKQEGLFHDKKGKLTIAIVHALITEKPLPHSAMHVCYKDIKTNYDYILVAHNHHPFEFKLKDTTVLDIGCVGRRKTDEQDIQPSVLLIDTETKELKIIKLKSAKEGKDIFDLEKIEKTKAFEGNLDNFISSLNSVKLQSLDIRGKVVEVGKKINETKEVVDCVIKRIGETEDK